ncbi:MAG: lipid A disaccharide synthetase [Candidatus Deianiraeaceae bacterium]|jgi:lipid A disaccharide synthetase
MKKIFIISGEKSGDLIANNVIQQIQIQHPNAIIKGVGGESFSQNGLQSLFDQKELSIMGFTEVIPKLKRIFQLISLTKKEIYSFKPEHIITVDSPGFNFQVIKSIQHARLSKKEIRNIFLNYTPKKTKKDPVKIIRFLQKVYNKTAHHISRFTKKYKTLAIILRKFSSIANFGEKVFLLLNNKYTGRFFKVLGKLLYFFSHSHIVQGIFLILFKEVIALIIIIQALIMYLSTYRYLRLPCIIVKKIYTKITQNNEAEKDLSQYFQKIIYSKLSAKNTIYCNIINIIEELPKFCKISIITNLQNTIQQMHKKFKLSAYSNAFLCKTYHIVAPSVWAYKKHRAKKVAKLYNTLFCILPFEPPYFEKYNLKTIFIGYPPYFRIQSIIKEQAQLWQSPATKHSTTTICITLGSRLSELKHHIPIIKNTIKNLNNTFPQKLQFCFISLSHTHNTILKEFSEFNNAYIADEKEKWNEIASAKFIIAKSGTNVMEFALLGIPSIVYYKANFITACIIKILIYNKIGTLLNFTAGKFILPEFIQENTKNIHKKAIEWIKIDDTINDAKEQMEKELEKFKSSQKPEEVILNNL